MTERTTVRLPEDLLTRARRKAVAERRTLTSLIEEGLRLVIAAKKRPMQTKHNDPPVSKAKGGLRLGFSWENLSSEVQEMDDLEYAERLTRFK